MLILITIFKFFLIFRVGRSITPPNALVSPATNSTMPTAAAVAAAAATAKIQALDAVASNAVLGLAAATPTFGISPLSAKVSSLPLPTPGNSLHSTISLPTTAVPSFISAGMFQNASVASNMMTASALQAVSSQAINTATKSIIGQTTNVTLPIIGKFNTSATEVNQLTSQPDSVLTLSTSTTSIPNAVTIQSDQKKSNDIQQEELKMKILDEGETQTLQQQENMSIKGQSARQFVMQRLMRPQDSRVIILRNMVGPEDVDETLQEEIQEECTKFGSVSRVIIFNEKQTENEDDDEAEIIVKIFVEFSTTAEATRGKDALHGRFFGGRRVIAELYDQSLFDHGDLSG